MTYKFPWTEAGESPKTVCHVDTGRWIPFDPANTDYQEYLAWLAEGNEPLPADPLPPSWPLPADPVE